MNRVLQIFLIVCLLLFLALIVRFISKKQLNLKYSLLWLLADLFMMVITIFPQIVDYVGNLVGIVETVNTVFLFSGMFMTLILLTLTFIVSRLNSRICQMAQYMALLEKKIRDIEGK